MRFIESEINQDEDVRNIVLEKFRSGANRGYLISNNLQAFLSQYSKRKIDPTGKQPLVTAFVKFLRETLKVNVFAYNLIGLFPGMFMNQHFDAQISEADTDKIQIVEPFAFYHCTGITVLKFNNLSAVYSNAFSNIPQLTQIELDGNGMKIGHHVFSDCPDLETVIIHNPSLIQVDTILDVCNNGGTVHLDLQRVKYVPDPGQDKPTDAESYQGAILEQVLSFSDDNEWDGLQNFMDSNQFRTYFSVPAEFYSSKASSKKTTTANVVNNAGSAGQNGNSTTGDSTTDISKLNKNSLVATDSVDTSEVDSEQLPDEDEEQNNTQK